MKLDHLRDYLTMPEVAAKWKATDAEMKRAVLKGLLRPSVYLNALYKPVEVADDGSVHIAEADPSHVLGWHYLTPIQQVGALDCTARTISVVPQAMPGSAMWALDRPLDMADVLREAVVMAEDLVHAESILEAETHWQQRSAKTKEFNSVLNVLSIVLADAYRFDPRVRSSIAREITEAGEQHGHAVSAGTVSKWIKEAIEQFPPAYMDEPVQQSQRESEAA